MGKVIHQFAISAVMQGWKNGPFERVGIYNGLCSLEDAIAKYGRVMAAVKSGEQITAIDRGMARVCSGVLSGAYQDVEWIDTTIVVWESRDERAAVEALVVESVRNKAGLSENCPVSVSIVEPGSEWIVSVTDGIVEIVVGRERDEILGGLNRLVAWHRMAGSTISLSDLL